MAIKTGKKMAAKSASVRTGGEQAAQNRNAKAQKG